MSDIDQTCAEIVRRSRSNFALSFRFLPTPQRRAMNTLYAFCRHTDDLADGPGSVEERRAALAAWRAEITDRGVDPVIRAMVQVTIDFDLDIDLLHAVIDGCEMDLAAARFAALDGLRHYCSLVAGAVGHLCLGIWGVRGGQADALAEDLGLAAQLTNILRDIGGDAAAGRMYLPLDMLRRHQVEESDVLQCRASAGLQACLMELATLAADAYDRADVDAFPAAQRRRLWPARIIRRIYRRLLDEIVARGFPLRERTRLSGFTKARLITPILLRRLVPL